MPRPASERGRTCAVGKLRAAFTALPRVVIVLGLVLAPFPIEAVDTTPSLPQILERVAAYVRQFEDEFTFILSDEDYVQTEVVSEPRASSFERRIRSETLFTWLPEERSYLTVRSVLTVNGVLIPDSKDRLNGALADRGPGRTTRLRRLRDESARFNLGRIYRNFNDPTLVLQFLDAVDQPRFKFSMNGIETVNGIDWWKIAFDEVAHPTVIGDQAGRDIVSSGLVWIRRSDCAVTRTSLSLHYEAENTRVAIDVDYSRDRVLGMWVPIRMRERYEQNAVVNSSRQGMPPRFATGRQRIECVAKYSNFRRFETSARVLPPQ